GDAVRNILLFFLMWSPSGAVWSIDLLLRRRRRTDAGEVTSPVFVPAWPLRILFVQLVFVYFFNGLHKLVGRDWLTGDAVYYVLANLATARFSYVDVPVPYFFTKILTWTVLAFEIGFPVWVAMPWTRTPVLLLGVCFHVGLGLSME